MFGKMKTLIKRRFPIFAGIARNLLWKYRNRSMRLRQSPYGFKIRASADMQKGTFEKKATEWFLKHIDGYDVFIDVGANVGYYSLLACHAGKKVVSIEPLQSNFEILCENLHANCYNNVEAFPVGLGNRPGLRKLYGIGTGASMVEGWDSIRRGHYNIVPVSTLDILLGKRFAGQKQLIKIDVEGLEYEVLQGSEDILTSEPPPTWFIEVCLSCHFSSGINPNFAKTFELFTTRNYKAYFLDSLKRVDRAQLDDWITSKAILPSREFLFCKKL